MGLSIVAISELADRLSLAGQLGAVVLATVVARYLARSRSEVWLVALAGGFGAMLSHVLVDGQAAFLLMLFAPIIYVIATLPGGNVDFETHISNGPGRSQIPLACRIAHAVLTLSTLWLGWLVMMASHELGHVLGAIITGGSVQRVIYYPITFSRTDVSPNPHPLFVVWAGPIVGIIVPVLIASLTSALRCSFAYLAWVIAGVCLLANGVYIGVGAVMMVGDARVMLRQGTPPWVMYGFGVVGLAAAVVVYVRLSDRMRFGSEDAVRDRKHALLMCMIAVVVTVAGLVWGVSDA